MRKYLLCAPVLLGAWFLIGQVPPDKPGPSQGPKFALSELEQAKLENLRLRRDLITLQQQLLADAVQGYVSVTLSVHGNPQGVQFNPKTFGFEVLPQTVEKPAHTNIEKNMQKK